MTSDALPVTDEEFERLVAECRTLLPAVGVYTEDDFGPYDDYITNVLLTVLDLQMHNVAVDNSIKYYWNHRWYEIRHLAELRAVLDRFPDTPEGNREAAQYLWGNNHWTRIGWLRGFVAFLEQESLTTQERLREWANACDYERDFRGRVKYLGNAACQWLRMRLGVDTVKPDVHTHNFVKHAIGRPLSDTNLVKVIEAAAHALNGSGSASRRRDLGAPAGCTGHDLSSGEPTRRLEHSLQNRQCRSALPHGCRGAAFRAAQESGPEPAIADTEPPSIWGRAKRPPLIRQRPSGAL